MNMPDEKALRHLNASLNLDALWIPFTANRQFKAAPRLLVSAKDMYYQTHDGRKVLDGIAGLWAVNAGHCRAPDRRGDQEAGGDHGLRHRLPDASSRGLPGRGKAGLDHAARA